MTSSTGPSRRARGAPGGGQEREPSQQYSAGSRSVPKQPEGHIISRLSGRWSECCWSCSCGAKGTARIDFERDVQVRHHLTAVQRRTSEAGVPPSTSPTAPENDDI